MTSVPSKPYHISRSRALPTPHGPLLVRTLHLARGQISSHGLDCPLGSLEAMASGNITFQTMHINSKGFVVVSKSWGEDNVEETGIMVV